MDLIDCEGEGGILANLATINFSRENLLHIVSQVCVYPVISILRSEVFGLSCRMSKLPRTCVLRAALSCVKLSSLLIELIKCYVYLSDV